MLAQLAPVGQRHSPHRRCPQRRAGADAAGFRINVCSWTHPPSDHVLMPEPKMHFTRLCAVLQHLPPRSAAVTSVRAGI